MKNQSPESDKNPKIMRKINEHNASHRTDEKYNLLMQFLLIIIQEKVTRYNKTEYQNHKRNAQSQIKRIYFIVTRLVQESYGRTLNIQIQDTVYFQNGGAKSILQSLKDSIDKPFQLRVQLWKGSLQKLMQIYEQQKKEDCKCKYIIRFDSKMRKIIISIEYFNILYKNVIKQREAVLVKFDDDSVQIMTEAEFFLLMSKRKGDKFWNKIFSILNYIKQRVFLTHRIHFNRKRDSNHTYFERSAMETRIIRGEVISASTEYISQAIEDDFLIQ
ncbi:unnamed protein product (macronuclear) [Paramecium tetraurelia]|uniref:Uncharacterized protein n=1 Tax=Paramecium tetraurelia TaxID=5888 RepID=A0BUA6_PARTE|nr:uncharacterized protein GSPATT00032355001 [Paramecium tetraurelia]CAK62123.1 unnamed protein product [Paramecium tetraurelia]|eukprot:XP_001429521.1 hypothetical protein (macronuclear) [Paramecium tetraurelia strain d4-2]